MKIFAAQIPAAEDILSSFTLPSLELLALPYYVVTGVYGPHAHPPVKLTCAASLIKPMAPGNTQRQQRATHSDAS